MTSPVDALLGDLAEAKRAEADAKKRRLEIEERLLALIADKPEKGRAKLGDLIKATVEFKLNYKADVESIRGIDSGNFEVPLKLIPAKWELDEKAYEALRTINPTLFAKVAAFVETKPAKPSFELKL